MNGEGEVFFFSFFIFRTAFLIYFLFCYFIFGHFIFILFGF
jgi:hypothetical protein